MSGITGIFQRDGQPVDRDVLQRMTDAMHRRGPDRRAIWVEGSIGFGHAALFSTLEAERENQPTTLDGQVWITGDARIDEWDDLRRKLEVKGETLSASVTDIELILRAYRVWGTACVDHLLGDFAFVIWDSREQCLLCARDHSGVKPFYYHLSDRLFVFGSEMRALLAMPDVPQRLNEARVADAIVDETEGVDHTSTFYLDIQRLPRAHSMVIDRTSTQQRRYWSLDSTREIRLKSDQEYAEAFLDVFRKAVICRLRTPERVGSMLSGGVDSSSVVAVARQWLKATGQAPLRTFSGIHTEDNLETRTIRQVVAQGDVQPHFVKVEEFEQFLPAFHSFDERGDELFDYAMHIIQLMDILAHRQHMKALLDGMPGDNITAVGSNYITWMLRDFKLVSAIRECRAWEQMWGENFWSVLMLHAKAAYFPQWLRAIKWRLTCHDPHQYGALIAETLIDPEFARRTNLLERFTAYYAHVDVRCTTREQHRRWLDHGMLPVAYERYDRVAARHSIEPRHPYADRRVIEFCLALPAAQKNHLAWAKVINRRALAPLLPAEVVWRSQKDSLDFTFAQERYRLQAQKIFYALRSRSADRLYSYVDKGKMQALLAQPPAFTSPQIFHILMLRSMMIWLEQYRSG